MLIDWFTVGAQAVNFIILVGLMKHFLYKPILSAIDAREKKVAAELAGAAAKEVEATNAREDLRRKNEAFDHDRAALLEKATREANAAQKALIDKARGAADALREAQEASQRDEARAVEHALRGRLQHEVFAIARKTLGDLANATLESRVVEVFVRRIEALDGAARATFAEGIQKAGQAPLVRTAFELDGEQRAALQSSLNRAFSADLHVRFEIAPELVSGIELVTTDQKLGWNILEYLGSLEKAVGDLLTDEDTTAAKAHAPPRTEPKPATPKPAPTPKAVAPKSDGAIVAKPETNSA